MDTLPASGRVLSTQFKWFPRGDIDEPIVSLCERHIHRPIDRAVTRLSLGESGRRRVRSALEECQIQMSTFPHFDAQICYLHAELSDHESLDSNPRYRPDSRAFPRLLERVAALNDKDQQEKATMIPRLVDLVTDLVARPRTAQRQPVTVTIRINRKKRSRDTFEEDERQESEYRSKRSKISGEIAQANPKKRRRDSVLDSGHNTAEEAERSAKQVGSCSPRPSQQKATSELFKQGPNISQALRPTDGTLKPRLSTEPVATEQSSQEPSTSQAPHPTGDTLKSPQSPQPDATEFPNEQQDEDEEEDPGADLCRFIYAVSEGLGIHWDIYDVHQFEWRVLILKWQLLQVFDPELEQQLREESLRAHQAAQEILDKSSGDDESSDDESEDDENLEEEQIQAYRDAYAEEPALAAVAAVRAVLQVEHHHECALSKKIALFEENRRYWLAKRDRQTNKLLWAWCDQHYYDTRQDLEDMLNSQQMWALKGGICSQKCAWR